MHSYKIDLGDRKNCSAIKELQMWLLAHSFFLQSPIDLHMNMFKSVWTCKSHKINSGANISFRVKNWTNKLNFILFGNTFHFQTSFSLICFMFISATAFRFVVVYKKKLLCFPRSDNLTTYKYFCVIYEILNKFLNFL